MTKAMFLRTLVALFAALALVLPARSADDASKAPQSYVIVVGVSNYGDKQIKPRPHAEDDAKALYDVFIDKKYLGVEAKNLHLLLGSDDAKRGSQTATKDNILTPEVKANGYGDVDLARLQAAIDLIGQSYKFKGKPSAADVFDASFLPPEPDRRAH